jgi:hypothetical protein
LTMTKILLILMAKICFPLSESSEIAKGEGWNDVASRQPRGEVFFCINIGK